MDTPFINNNAVQGNDSPVEVSEVLLDIRGAAGSSGRSHMLNGLADIC